MLQQQEEEEEKISIHIPNQSDTTVEGSGLRARTYARHLSLAHHTEVVSGAWQKRVRMAISWGLTIRFLLFLLLLITVIVACFTLPVDKLLNQILIWVHQNLGPWGPVVLALMYIPLSVLAVPASILTVSGGYLFGLPIGFLADSTGALLGATAAFLVGKTVGRSYVMAKLKDYPQFQAAAFAIRKSGFKIVLLLRLVPFLPFNILNYILSVAPLRLWEYMVASWIGMMPGTLALVYVGTTIKDIADVAHGWEHFSTVRWILLAVGLASTVVLLMLLTRVAKASLNTAIIDSENDMESSRESLLNNGVTSDLHQSLLIRSDTVDSSKSKD